MHIKDSLEYMAIKDYYGDKRTERSNVLLINHIDEGLDILDVINSTDNAKRAYCLHPLFQADNDLFDNRHLLNNFDSEIIALTFEYRNIANAYLSTRTITAIEEIKLSPLKEVNDMLIADKIQNFKDFMQYHFNTHTRSKELFEYFKNWFLKLNIPIRVFEEIEKDSTSLPLELFKRYI